MTNFTAAKKTVAITKCGETIQAIYSRLNTSESGIIHPICVNVGKSDIREGHVVGSLTIGDNMKPLNLRDKSLVEHGELLYQGFQTLENLVPNPIDRITIDTDSEAAKNLAEGIVRGAVTMGTISRRFSLKVKKNGRVQFRCCDKKKTVN